MTDLIDWKELRRRIPWSRAHIQRLEDANKFPRRVSLNPGLGRNSRVGWVKQEIDDHVEELVRRRNDMKASDRANAPTGDAGEE